MKGTFIGEFEELVLLSIAILTNDAYGVSIKEEIRKKTGRNPSIGALHSSFKRLEEKGFIKSQLGEETPERGGRRKLYYTLTISGIKTLKKSRELRNAMWDEIPKLILDIGKS